MHDLFEGVSGLKNVITPVRAKAAFWNMYVYTDQRNLSAAMAAIDEAFKYQKSSFILYHKAKLLYSAGLNEMALDELNSAIELELKVPKYKQQRLDEYITTREFIAETVIGRKNES